MAFIFGELVQFDGFLEVEGRHDVLDDELLEVHREPQLLDDLGVLAGGLVGSLFRLGSGANLKYYGVVSTILPDWKTKAVVLGSLSLMMTAANLFGLYSAYRALWDILVRSSSVDRFTVETTFWMEGGWTVLKSSCNLTLAKSCSLLGSSIRVNYYCILLQIMLFSEDSCLGRLFLRKWHPQPTIPCAMVIFLTVGSLCIILGIVIMVMNSKIVEFHIGSYDDYENCKQAGYNKPCSFTVQFPEMEGPVFMFYELSNFYQSHRRYVKSKNNNQLANLGISFEEADKFCSPVVENEDLFEWQQLKPIDIVRRQVYITKDNKREQRTVPLNSKALANPCGLIAKSFFNDTFQLYAGKSVATATRVPISETGISWDNDAGQRFKTGNKDQQWIDVENEHFIVWMRTAGLPEFRKLWGRLDDGIKEGEYTFLVENNYNPNTFDGTKDLIFSTSGPFGGKNDFLGIAYLVVGGLCFFIALGFWIQSRTSAANYGRKMA